MRRDGEGAGSAGSSAGRAICSQRLDYLKVENFFKTSSNVMIKKLAAVFDVFQELFYKSMACNFYNQVIFLFRTLVLCDE